MFLKVWTKCYHIHRTPTIEPGSAFVPATPLQWSQCTRRNGRANLLSPHRILCNINISNVYYRKNRKTRTFFVYLEHIYLWLPCAAWCATEVDTSPVSAPLKCPAVVMRPSSSQPSHCLSNYRQFKIIALSITCVYACLPSHNPDSISFKFDGSTKTISPTAADAPIFGGPAACATCAIIVWHTMDHFLGGLCNPSPSFTRDSGF